MILYVAFDVITRLEVSFSDHSLSFGQFRSLQEPLETLTTSRPKQEAKNKPGILAVA